MGQLERIHRKHRYSCIVARHDAYIHHLLGRDNWSLLSKHSLDEGLPFLVVFGDKSLETPSPSSTLFSSQAHALTRADSTSLQVERIHRKRGYSIVAEHDAYIHHLFGRDNLYFHVEAQLR